MVAVKANYEQISETYGTDFGGLRALCREVCVGQVSKHLQRVARGLDCAVGTGEVLADLSQHIEVESLVGNDLSEAILARAKGLGLSGFEPLVGSALDLEEHLDAASRDFIACHFLYDYCGVGPMSEVMSRLLEPGGYVSSMTSTKSQYDDVFWDKARRHPRLTRAFDVRRSIASGSTPESHAHHCEVLEAQGLKVVEAHEVVHPLEAHSSADLWNALYDSGWAIGSLSRFSPWQLRIARLALGAFDLPMLGLFPFQLNASISVVLAQRPV